MNDPVKSSPWAGADGPALGWNTDGLALGWLPLLCPRAQPHLLSRRKMQGPQLSRVCPPPFTQRCFLGPLGTATPSWHWRAPRHHRGWVSAVRKQLRQHSETCLKTKAMPSHRGTGTPRQPTCCEQSLLVLPPPSRVLHPCLPYVHQETSIAKGALRLPWAPHPAASYHLLRPTVSHRPSKEKRGGAVMLSKS